MGTCVINGSLAPPSLALGPFSSLSCSQVASPSCQLASLFVLLCPSLSRKLHPEDAVLIEVLVAKLSLELS